MPRRVSERAVGCYEEVSFHTVKGAGHGFFKEVGEAVDKQIVEWLRKRVSNAPGT